MKKIIALTLSIIVAVGLLTGCKSPQQNAVTASLITLAVSGGSVGYITSHPASRPDFVAADVALAALSSSTNTITITQVEQALQVAGPSGSTPAIAVVVSNLIPMLQSYEAQNSSNTTISTAQTFLVAVKTGLDQALLVTAPAAPVVVPPIVNPPAAPTVPAK